MRRIDLTNYDIRVKTPEGDKTIPYFTKESLTLAMYADEMKLGARELLENDRLAQKIQKADTEILLEESEYERLKRAIESIHGFHKDDVELVKRVLDAQQVEVKEV